MKIQLTFPHLSKEPRTVIASPTLACHDQHISTTQYDRDRLPIAVGTAEEKDDGVTESAISVNTLARPSSGILTRWTRVDGKGRVYCRSVSRTSQQRMRH